LLGDIRYVTALLATLVGWWTISGPAQIIGPIFAEERLGFTDVEIGYATTMLSVGEILILFVAGRATDHYGRRAVLVPSLIVAAVATALVGGIENVTWAYYPLLAAVGMGIAAGSTASGALLADAVPKGGSGTAVGVNQMAGDLGYLLAPSAIGYVAESSFGVAYALAAVPAALVLVLAVRLPGRDRGIRRQELEPVEPVG
jgi:MFS family permease